VAQDNLDIGQLPGQNFYCRLIIKGQEYLSPNIVSLVIREWVIDVLPRLELQIFDDGSLFELSPLEDSEIISILIGKNLDDPNPLQLDFMLSDYVVDQIADNRKVVISLTGYLQVTDMFNIRTRAFKKNSSVNVLSEIANESELSFQNPLNVMSLDNMTWYQSSQSNYDFIRHVLERAYVPNDTVFFYANTQNKFVYTSLNSELSKKNVKLARFDIDNYYKDLHEFDKTLWFNKYDIVNYKGYFNKKIAYGFKYNYYDLSKNMEEEYTSSSSLTDFLYKTVDMRNLLVYNYQGGMYNNLNIYGETFFESKIRNEYLKSDFFGISVVININAMGQVNLFDKIDLILPSLLENEMNESMSGQYIVGGIVHHISKGGIYKKMISLHRNGINVASNFNQYRMIK
jgi:hypothetical protein